MTRMQAPRVGRTMTVAAGGVVVALLAAGCAAHPPTTVVPGATPTASTTSTPAPPPTPSTPRRAASAKPTTAPEPARTTAVGKVNLPSAASIGAGFRAHAEDADGDARTDANGAGVDERTPQDVVDGLVPLGCPGVEAGTLPLPANAWQQTFRSTDGRMAVALVLDYPSSAKATELVSTLGTMLATCVAPTSVRDLTTARTVATLATRSTELIQDTRHEVGPEATTQTWDESIVRTANRVGMVVVERGTTASRPDQAAVAAGIRAGLLR
jgi:hypothetical protein